MKAFYDQFPSLKGKYSIQMTLSRDGTEGFDSVAIISLSEKDMKTNCIDKEFVREVFSFIKKYIPTQIRDADAGTFAMSKLLFAIETKEKELEL